MKRNKFITWHVYVPWYAIGTILIVYCLMVGIGPVWRDWHALLTLPFTTFSIFSPWMCDVWLWPRLRIWP